MDSEKKLRSSLIKLAYEKPELREKILPLVKKEAAPVRIQSGSTISYNPSDGSILISVMISGGNVNSMLIRLKQALMQKKFTVAPGVGDKPGFVLMIPPRSPGEAPEES